jgi:hypothetical protein
MTVTLDKDGVSYSTPVPAGRVQVRVVNEGDTPHGLTMLPLGDDEPPIGELLTNDTAEVRAPFAGVPPLEPGQTARFAVDLDTGRRYALYDSTTKPGDLQGRSHAQTGWHTEFRTPGELGRPR